MYARREWSEVFKVWKENTKLELHVQQNFLSKVKEKQILKQTKKLREFTAKPLL